MRPSENMNLAGAVTLVILFVIALIVVITLASCASSKYITAERAAQGRAKCGQGLR